MKKVLIVEDDPPYRRIYSKKFEVAGYQVETAVDGEEGLSKMYSFMPDIVLTDLMMPKIDGFHLLERAKADDKIKHIPIVVLTNLSTSEDAQKVTGMGAAASMVKSDTEPHLILEKAEEILRSK
jgi:CheY-like chemotaxis protein